MDELTLHSHYDMHHNNTNIWSIRKACLCKHVHVYLYIHRCVWAGFRELEIPTEVARRKLKSDIFSNSTFFNSFMFVYLDTKVPSSPRPRRLPDLFSVHKKKSRIWYLMSYVTSSTAHRHGVVDDHWFETHCQLFSLPKVALQGLYHVTWARKAFPHV